MADASLTISTYDTANSATSVSTAPQANPVDEVEFDSVGVNAFTVAASSEAVRKTLMSRLIAEDCMVLEITSVKSNLEDVFVKLTASSRTQSREDAFEELGKEMDEQRKAEESAQDAEDTPAADAAESEKEAKD